MDFRDGLATGGSLRDNGNRRQPFVMIDGFNLSLQKGTGVATYARNLSSAVHELGFEVGILYGNSISDRHPPLLKEVMFFDPPQPVKHPLIRGARGLRALARTRSRRAFEVPISGAVIAEPFRSQLPYYDSIWNAPDLYFAAGLRFDLFGSPQPVKPKRMPQLVHWTYPLPVYIPGIPNIYTLHDVVPLRLPYTTMDKKARYFKLLRWICRHAAHIVTVSENSKRDIVELLEVDPSKITNTYQAVRVPEKLLEKPEDEIRREVESTVGLSYKNYFLFYGSIEPKKNLGRLIAAYLASGVEEVAPDFRTVL